MDCLEQVKKKLVTINGSVHALKNQERGFLEQIQAARKEIEATVQQLMQLLQESKRQLMRELDQVTDFAIHSYRSQYGNYRKCGAFDTPT